MRVFLDTNVILEFFIEREDVRKAAQLFSRLKEEKAEMYMSVGSFIQKLKNNGSKYGKIQIFFVSLHRVNIISL